VYKVSLSLSLSMNPLVLVIALGGILVVLPPLSAQPTTEAPIVWRDEFDGSSSSVNSAYWTLRTGNNAGWGNAEIQEYTTDTDNVRVADAQRLEITVVEEDNGVFTSGRIDTLGKVHMLYGRVTARIKNPKVDVGLAPAFWTMGVDGDWPTNGIIDVMQVGQGKAVTDGVANKRVVSGAIWENDNQIASYAGWLNCEDVTADYNTYTLDWTPTSLTTYLNDAMIWKMDIDETKCPDCQEFHKPHYLILNTAVGGSFVAPGGDSSDIGCGYPIAGGNCGDVITAEEVTAPTPATMMVDWVRMYDNGYTQVLVVNGPPSQQALSPARSPVLSDQGSEQPPVQAEVAPKAPSRPSVRTKTSDFVDP
jgi:Glycosyl hydrolases family 16